MITCPSCGNENRPGAVYCVHCGTKMDAAPPLGATAVGGTRNASLLMERLRQATLGEYEVLGEVGRGGMAIVYLAHDLSLDRRVAIKVVSPGLLWDDQGMAERFKREARTAAALSHPHIIPIYAVRESEDLLYFVMKFVQGRTLGSVISELGRLPFAMVQTILGQVGSALGYAHRRGVVHRDIKPGNVMLDEEGWAVVTDFGVAKVAAAEGLTQTGGTLGTPTYMSPEQCSGLAVTGASDQYSLGVVAYQMLAGVKPFEGASAMAVMYHHLHTPPTPVEQHVPDCPPALAQAVMRMLEKEPENRWPSLEDMVAALATIGGEDSSEVRTQMLTLVQTGGAQALVGKFTTPSNLSPFGRPASAPTPTPTPSAAAPLPAPAEPPAALAGPPPAPAEAHAAGRRPPRVAVLALPVLIAAVGLALWRPWAGGASGPASQAESEPPTAPEPAPRPTAPIAAAISLVPRAPRVRVGDRVQLTAEVRDGAGGALPTAPVAWTSNEPGVAEVSPEGWVTGRQEGRAEIRAVSGEAEASAIVVVEAPPASAAPAPPSEPTPASVAAVAVTPAAQTLTVGETAQLGATPSDAAGNQLADRPVTWSSDNQQVATVSDRGVVTAVGEGGTVIRAASEGRLGMASITVRAMPVASVEVSPRTRTLQAGESVQLSATPRDPGGAALPDRPIRWTSSADDVARVAPDGRATAVGPGSATITASSEGVSGSASITVAAPAAPTPTVEPRVAVEQVVQTYGQAIQAKSLSDVRRVFPDLPADQATGWSNFFQTSTDLSVTLDRVSVTVTGDAAQASFRQRLSYRSGGPRQTLEQTVTASLVRRGGEWLITGVH
jgi:serine/threonine protein kinase